MSSSLVVATEEKFVCKPKRVRSKPSRTGQVVNAKYATEVLEKDTKYP